MNEELLDGRAEREAQFYDENRLTYRFERALIERSIGGFGRQEDYRDFYEAGGKTVLDYGCGEGAVAFRALEEGAKHATGIDISEARVVAARQKAVERGVADRAEFITGEAIQTGFDDASFDLVLGTAILHHLDMESCLREIRRVLRPGGRAVFAEPLIHNPILRLGRWLTPSARTEDELPLSVDDWEVCASVFPGFVHHEREFISIPLMPLNLLLPRAGQERLARRVARFDDWALARFPRLRKYARVTILVLE